MQDGECDFSGASFCNVVFDKCDFSNCSFRDTYWKNVNVSNSKGTEASSATPRLSG
ncbi:MAG: pentapeptide repeat-containing protein [Acutalibacteraceae bacterium]